jgi:hypothetical protein
MKLSSTEAAAISILKHHGGCMLTSRVPEKNERDIVFGNIEPGMGVYKKLEKKGLVVITEEEPMDDGFCFTNEIYLTEEGRAL